MISNLKLQIKDIDSELQVLADSYSHAVKNEPKHIAREIADVIVNMNNSRDTLQLRLNQMTR